MRTNVRVAEKFVRKVETILKKSSKSEKNIGGLDYTAQVPR